MNLIKPKTALISLSDKTNLEELISFLLSQNVKMISTGGTYQAIKKITDEVIEVSDFTGFEEMMDGRVKTLHPKIHAGILARRDQDMGVLEERGYEVIDLVIVNLYPFKETIASDCSFEDAIEKIDIGGPTMIRSAAKNFKDVAVITNPQDYSVLMSEWSEQGGISYEFRKQLSQKVFALMADYNLAISEYLADETTGLPNYSFEKIDVCNRDDLIDCFNRFKPDAIMHLAAESHVDRSIDAPSTFIYTNIIGTYEILEASRHFWKKEGQPESFRFHHISTDEVYGSLGATGLFTEKTPYDPKSPYSASKASSDHLVRAWHETYGLPIVLTNCSNNYGPFHFPEKLIPVVIIKAISGEKIPIYGTGDNIRDWLYVEDHADALLSVIKDGEIGRSYNIGGKNEATNLELVQKICVLLDNLQPQKTPYADQITFVTDRPGHDQRYAIDPSRIINELNWKPSVTLDEGLRKTVLWYLENKDWWKALQDREGVGSRLGKI